MFFKTSSYTHNKVVKPRTACSTAGLSNNHGARIEAFNVEVARGFSVSQRDLGDEALLSGNQSKMLGKVDSRPTIFQLTAPPNINRVFASLEADVHNLFGGIRGVRLDGCFIHGGESACNMHITVRIASIKGATG